MQFAVCHILCRYTSSHPKKQPSSYSVLLRTWLLSPLYVVHCSLCHKWVNEIAKPSKAKLPFGKTTCHPDVHGIPCRAGYRILRPVCRTMASLSFWRYRRAHRVTDKYQLVRWIRARDLSVDSVRQHALKCAAADCVLQLFVVCVYRVLEFVTLYLRVSVKFFCLILT